MDATLPIGDGTASPAEPGTDEFGELEDYDLRLAWEHEARDFTPWLAKNLDRLSEAIGVQLELEATETPVGRFAGDVLATADGQSVVIENQLEGSDHTHLGQIMTYLAGLDAHIVVWIARDFNEEHLSAMQWLNRHTEDGFAFFAVRLRVVRIADSPLAPIFEILAKPNNWEREVRREKTEGRARLTKKYREFWTHYSRRYPEDGVRGNHGLANFWIKPRKAAPAISMAFSYVSGAVGIFFTPRGLSEEAMKEWRAERREAIAEILGGEPAAWKSYDTRNRDNWDAMCDWLHEKLNRFLMIVEVEPEGS